jgi:hypothetical protein
MIDGVTKVVVENEDEERARAFSTEVLGLEIAEGACYGRVRWLEVYTPMPRWCTWRSHPVRIARSTAGIVLLTISSRLRMSLYG